MVEEPVPITEALDRIMGKSSSTQKQQMLSAISTRKKTPICKQVFINEKDKGKPMRYWITVSRGIYAGVDFLYTNPPSCILAPVTNIVYSKACKYSFKELENNILLEEDCGTGKKHLYPYPKKTWDELYRFYVKPMIEGQDPFNVGVILMGPPGTGKSRLAQIISNYAGFNVFRVDSSLLSKWVGESENKLNDLIAEARNSQPAIVVIDDAEWITMARKLAGETGDGLAETRLNLQQILFNKMQEIYDYKERVLFIATTNMKQEIHDPAIIRYGRFGPPVFLPLPDLEAAKIIIRDILPDKPEEEVEKIAFKAVNAGLSVADIIAIAEKVKRGGEAKPQTVGGRGYMRIYIDRVEGFKVFEDKFHIPVSRMLSARSRLYIGGDEDIATAFAIQFAYTANKTVIKLVDTRYLGEAIHSANMLGSVFIAPTKLAPEYQYYIKDNITVPVFFVGEKPPMVSSFPLGDVKYIIGRVGVEESVKAVLAYKGLNTSKGFLEKVKKKAADDYGLVERVLMLINTTGVVDEKYFENMLSWIKS